MLLAVRYREFDPCPALRSHVRRFYTFAAPAEPDTPTRPVKRELLYQSAGSISTPLFADGHMSIAFSFGSGYRIDGLWSTSESRKCGHVIGAMSTAHPATHGEQVIEVGAYLQPAQAGLFLKWAAWELTDRILPICDLWGAAGASVEERLAEARNDDERVCLLESSLVERVKTTPRPRGSLDLQSLIAHVQQQRGDVRISQLAGAAGLSRQHLGRVFRDEIGMSPKLFCRLARFRAALAASARRLRNDPAGLSAELGYTDQSHMIAEFREFSGLTPKPLLLHQRVHPFMDLA
jgi:AraC-like DNA-binding protein